MKKTTRVWTTQELAYLRQAHAKRIPHKVMAERLGRSVSAVATCISQKIIHGKIVASNLPSVAPSSKEFTVSMPVSIQDFKIENGVLTMRLKGN